jgi:hypothetical protein
MKCACGYGDEDISAIASAGARGRRTELAPRQGSLVTVVNFRSCTALRADEGGVLFWVA